MKGAIRRLRFSQIMEKRSYNYFDLKASLK